MGRRKMTPLGKFFLGMSMSSDMRPEGWWMPKVGWLLTNSKATNSSQTPVRCTG